MDIKSKRIFLLMFVLLTAWNCAYASTLQIDGAIGMIPNLLLVEDNEITALVIEDGITDIGAGAFSCDTALRLAVIPSTVQQIGEGVFKQCGPMLVQCSPESAAMRYAQEMHIEYSADTTRRALLIGQSDYPEKYTLSAPMNDVDAVSRVLPGFEVTIAENLTADGILTAIDDTFAQGTVKKQDVSLLYYSGHGLENGSLLGIDLEELTMSSFHQALDAIPGRKILILDCCYSGRYIPQGLMSRRSEVSTSVDQFNANVIAEFAPSRLRAMPSEMPADIQEYYILTACAADELSWESKKSARHFGVFTRYMSMGLGYDERDEVECDRFADLDNDGVITIKELYEYSRANVAALNTPDEQNVQVFPIDADDYALYRADPRTAPMKKLGVIVYDACGGSSAPDRQLVMIGEQMQLSPVVPVLSGCRFDGWSNTKGSKDALYQAGAAMTPSGSTTLFAVWTVINHEFAPDKSVWFKGSKSVLTFTDSWQGEPIEYVRVDGIKLPQSAYTLSSDGRTIVLKPEWLNTQSIGRHMMECHFADSMTASLHFEIASMIPKTGDTGAPLLWLVLSVCGIIFLRREHARYR